MWSHNSENYSCTAPKFGRLTRIIGLLISKYHLDTGRYTCIYLQTYVHIYTEIHMQRRDKLRQHHFVSRRVGMESKGPFHMSSSVESHGIPWHGVSFLQQREVSAFSFSNSFCILHEHSKVTWNSCNLCEIYPPHLIAKFYPSTIFSF